MDDRLLDILACPVCKGPLKFQKADAVLVCRAERLAFPIRATHEHRGRLLQLERPLAHGTREDIEQPVIHSGSAA